MVRCDAGLQVKMKLPPACWTGGGDRLAGEQIVAEEDRPEMGRRRTMPCEPAFDGVAFAILLLRAILGDDELRR